MADQEIRTFPANEIKDVQKILHQYAQKFDWLNAKTYETIINLNQPIYKWIFENLDPDGNCLYRGVAELLEYNQFKGIFNPAIAKQDNYQLVKDCIFKDYMSDDANINHIILLLNTTYRADIEGMDITKDYFTKMKQKLYKNNEHADDIFILSVIISQTFKCNITIWTIDSEFNLYAMIRSNYPDSDTITVDINLLYVCKEEESRTGRGKNRSTAKVTVGHYLVMRKKNE